MLEANMACPVRCRQEWGDRESGSRFHYHSRCMPQVRTRSPFVAGVCDVKEHWVEACGHKGGSKPCLPPDLLFARWPRCAVQRAQQRGQRGGTSAAQHGGVAHCQREQGPAGQRSMHLSCAQSKFCTVCAPWISVTLPLLGHMRRSQPASSSPYAAQHGGEARPVSPLDAADGSLQQLACRLLA